MTANSKNIKSRLLLSTAIFAALGASNAKAAPVELNDVTDYNASFYTDGFIESSAGTTNASASPVGTASVGDGTHSLNVTNSASILNFKLYGDLTLTDDISVTSGAVLNLGVSDTVTFNGNIDQSTMTIGNATFGSGTATFSIASPEDIVINSTIDGNASNLSSAMIISNVGGNSGNTILFEQNIGANNALDSITIGNAGSSNTNNVYFEGSEIHADQFNIGITGGADQTNTITFNNSIAKVYANITGNAADTNTIRALGNTLELYGTTTGIDYLRLYSADLRVTNDYNGVIINIQDSGSTITFNNEGKDDSSEISQVNVDVNALSGQPQSIYFNNVDYSGAITLNSGNDYILFEENAEVDGSINFGNGDDQLQSFGANNLISADVDFGGGTDVFSVGDETMTVTGNMTGLENVEVFDGGLYQQQHLTVNNIVLGNSTLQIGAGKSVVTDAFSTDSGSILIFDVNSPANAGFLEVTDMGLDLTGLTVKANLTGADNVFTNGGTIAVATGDAPIIGYDGNTGFGPTVIDENSAMFSIMAMDGSYLSTPGNSSDLYFVFDQESTIEEIANTSNNKNAGRILDTISGTSDPELSEVIGHINAGDEDEVNDIISTLTPTVDVGGAVGTQNFVNNTLDVTNDRISSLQDNETSMSAGNESGLRAWSQVFGQRNLQGEREGIAGYDSNTYGAAFGLDTKSLVDNALLGAVISYGNTDVDSNNANSTSTGIDSYQFTLYGDYDFEKGSYARAMAAYSYNDVDTVRHNVGGLGVNAHGDYQADVYTLRTETGHDFKYANTRITPNLMAHYSHYNAEGYTEKGAGGAGLKVDGNSMNIFEVGAGVESGWDFKTEEGESIKPELRAGYRYDLIGDNLNISSSFVGGGSSFDTQGADPARGTISLGGGLTYYTVDNWEVSGNYEFEHKSDYNSNSGFLRAAYKF